MILPLEWFNFIVLLKHEDLQLCIHKKFIKYDCIKYFTYDVY